MDLISTVNPLFNEDLLCMLRNHLNQPRVCIGKAYFICEGRTDFSFKKLLVSVSDFIVGLKSLRIFTVEIAYYRSC